MKENNNKNPLPLFGFKIDKERLLEFSSIPLEKRLNWLEEANVFLSIIADEATKNKWKLFRERGF